MCPSVSAWAEASWVPSNIYAERTFVCDHACLPLFVAVVNISSQLELGRPAAWRAASLCYFCRWLKQPVYMLLEGARCLIVLLPPHEISVGPRQRYFCSDSKKICPRMQIWSCVSCCFSPSLFRLPFVPCKVFHQCGKTPRRAGAGPHGATETLDISRRYMHGANGNVS